MPKPAISTYFAGLLCAMALGCSSGASHPIHRRAPQAVDTCQDTLSCCLTRNPRVPGNCGLTESQAALYLDSLKARQPNGAGAPGRPARDWQEACADTHSRCVDGMERWEGNCNACFRLCKAEREWPSDVCFRR